MASEAHDVVAPPVEIKINDKELAWRLLQALAVILPQNSVLIGATGSASTANSPLPPQATPTPQSPYDDEVGAAEHAMCSAPTTVASPLSQDRIAVEEAATHSTPTTDACKWPRGTADAAEGAVCSTLSASASQSPPNMFDAAEHGTCRLPTTKATDLPQGSPDAASGATCCIAATAQLRQTAADAGQHGKSGKSIGSPPPARGVCTEQIAGAARCSASADVPESAWSDWVPDSADVNLTKMVDVQHGGQPLNPGRQDLADCPGESRQATSFNSGVRSTNVSTLPVLFEHEGAVAASHKSKAVICSLCGGTIAKTKLDYCQRGCCQKWLCESCASKPMRCTAGMCHAEVMREDAMSVSLASECFSATSVSTNGMLAPRAAGPTAAREETEEAEAVKQARAAGSAEGIDLPMPEPSDIIKILTRAKIALQPRDILLRFHNLGDIKLGNNVKKMKPILYSMMKKNGAIRKVDDDGNFWQLAAGREMS